MGAFKDLTGQVFGRLTVIRRVENGPGTPSRPNGYVQYECRCSCPDHTVLVVTANRLISGNTRGCGCLRKEHAVELAKSKIKWTDDELKILDHYHNMWQRCYYPGDINYKNYGGRGIRVCDEWLNPETGRQNFVNWAKSTGYIPGLTLERRNEGVYSINQDGLYAPWNCRWATRHEQANNTRRSVFVELNGIRHTISEWSDLLKENYTTVLYRYNSWGLDRFKDYIREKLHL